MDAFLLGHGVVYSYCFIISANSYDIWLSQAVQFSYNSIWSSLASQNCLTDPPPPRLESPDIESKIQKNRTGYEHKNWTGYEHKK